MEEDSDKEEEHWEHFVRRHAGASDAAMKDG
jgi:hypothetical protein